MLLNPITVIELFTTRPRLLELPVKLTPKPIQYLLLIKMVFFSMFNPFAAVPTLIP